MALIKINMVHLRKLWNHTSDMVNNITYSILEIMNLSLIDKSDINPKILLQFLSNLET